MLATLTKKWVMLSGKDEALEISGRSLRSTTDLFIDTLYNTVQSTYKLLISIAGRHFERVDWLTLLKIDGEGVVSVLHALFCVAGRVRGMDQKCLRREGRDPG